MSSDTRAYAASVALAAASAALEEARAAEREKWREVQLAAWYGEAAEDAAAVVAREATETAEAAWRAWIDAKRACRERAAGRGWCETGLALDSQRFRVVVK